MPELPEVETTARGLRARLIGRRILSAGGVDWPRMLPNATPESLDEVVRGRAVERVERRGKYLLIGLAGDAWLVVHRKMSGNLVVRGADRPAPRHTHLTLALDDGTCLDYADPRKFGRVYLFLDRAALDDFLAARLGPEPLEIEAAELERRLLARRGRLKSLLLDQSFLAGIGNIYTDEILWTARLHPERLATTLTPRERERLHAATCSVLSAAIERRGTTFSQYVDEAGLPGENQLHLQVYGRAGQPCPRAGCGRPIERRILAQRGTWLCPHCQRE
ncbi:MAG: DNA-formamidopyrimidine glycosylase [Chloroflexota bacterium]|nr:DNA-formamidopyrimidine glycosylase [Chloroflexota bacterium]